MPSFNYINKQEEKESQMENVLYVDDAQELPLREKLETILSTLLEEMQQITEFYTIKISQLYDEIADKDLKIHQLQQQLKRSHTQISNISAEIQQKQNLFHNIFTTFQSHPTPLPKSIHQYVEKFDFTFNNSQPKNQKDELDKNTRINISEYFMKSYDKCRQGKDAFSESSTFSTLNTVHSRKLFCRQKRKEEEKQNGIDVREESERSQNKIAWSVSEKTLGNRRRKGFCPH